MLQQQTEWLGPNNTAKQADIDHCSLSVPLVSPLGYYKKCDFTVIWETTCSSLRIIFLGLSQSSLTFLRLHLWSTSSMWECLQVCISSQLQCEEQDQSPWKGEHSGAVQVLLVLLQPQLCVYSTMLWAVQVHFHLHVKAAALALGTVVQI